VVTDRQTHTGTQTNASKNILFRYRGEKTAFDDSRDPRYENNSSVSMRSNAVEPATKQNIPALVSFFKFRLYRGNRPKTSISIGVAQTSNSLALDMRRKAFLIDELPHTSRNNFSIFLSNLTTFVVLETARSWFRDRSILEFCGLGLGTCGLDSVFTTSQTYIKI